MINAILVADKVTQGAVRFTEAADTEAPEKRPLNLYLRIEEVEALGLKPSVGEAIIVKIDAAIAA